MKLKWIMLITLLFLIVAISGCLEDNKNVTVINKDKWLNGLGETEYSVTFQDMADNHIIYHNWKNDYFVYKNVEINKTYNVVSVWYDAEYISKIGDKNVDWRSARE